ncbi:MAG: hypothetical protein ACJA0X_002933, partial [Cyclobacteriaceae bacterium]
AHNNRMVFFMVVSLGFFGAKRVAFLISFNLNQMKRTNTKNSVASLFILLSFYNT